MQSVCAEVESEGLENVVKIWLQEKKTTGFIETPLRGPSRGSKLLNIGTCLTKWTEKTGKKRGNHAITGRPCIAGCTLPPYSTSISIKSGHILIFFDKQ